MMTIAQARAIVGQQLGLPSFDGSVDAYRALTPGQQIDLTKALFSYIQKNPENFTTGQLETVKAESPRLQAAQIEDTSFSVSEFMNELETNAYKTVGEPLVNLGQGVTRSVNLVGTLLPIAVLAVLVIVALPYIQKARASA